MNILDFSTCIYLDPERFLWIFFSFLLQGQSPNELYCRGKENDPQSSPTEHMLYFVIHRRCSALPIKTRVMLLQRLSREPGHECTPCVSWHFLSVLKLTVCGVFPKSHYNSPTAPHLPFLSQSTTRVHQNIYYKLSGPGTVLQLYIFLFCLYLTALSLNVDVSGETRHSSVYPKWRKINKCSYWTQV